MLLNDIVGRDEVDDVHFPDVTLDVVFNVHRSQLFRWRETVHLTVVDGLHERRFTATVRAAQTVSFTLLHVQSGVVEQNERTVRQGKVALAQVFAFFVFNYEDFLRGQVQLFGLGNQSCRQSIRVGVKHFHVRRRTRLGPLVLVKVLLQERVDGQGANVIKDRRNRRIFDKLRNVRVRGTSCGDHERL